MPDRLPDQPGARPGATRRASSRPTSPCWSCTATSGASCSTRSRTTTSCSPATRCCCATRTCCSSTSTGMVVLDEAQAIKNPATKLARTACQLKAEHRLALSGTPMENHLGELWSVFNFLMPGFLGDRETFRRVFRNQIEKEGDTGAAAAAGQPRPAVPAAPHQGAGRLRAAAEAGGACSEIELSRGPARPLRERAPVDAQAGARRDRAARPRPQQHRDPRGAAQAAPGLLRPAPAQERAPTARVTSAKFELLMDMLPSMVEAGRSVIVFSQFVEMLELIEAGLVERADPVRQAHRPDQGPRDARSAASRTARCRSS